MLPFASIHAHKGWTQSRRDDLESAGFMLVALLQGCLPWERFWNGRENFSDHCVKQKSLPPKVICRNCPEEFQLYLQYCGRLRFQEEPDYHYLHGLLRSAFEREGFVDDGIFDSHD